jgi:hypothetical protein
MSDIVGCDKLTLFPISACVMPTDTRSEISFCQSMGENIGVTISFVNRHTDKNKHQTDWMELDAKNQTTIGDRVKQARTQARLTQMALAKKTGKRPVSDLKAAQQQADADV